MLGTTFTGHRDDISGINNLLVELRDERGLDVPLHVDGASGGFVWPFLYPDSEWDFRLEQVRSINVSGHKFGLVYPGIGWVVFREKSDLAEDIVFYENYLGKTDATFMNFSTGSAMVLAQYYNFVRFGRRLPPIMEMMQANARALAERIADIGEFGLIGDEGAEQLPLIPLEGDHDYDEFDVASQLRPSARLDGARLQAAAERRPRHDHARACQADARALARVQARRRHRGGVRDAEEEGRPARPRPHAGEDRHWVLSHTTVE